MPRLNGKKCLIRGNHDTFKLSWYALWFYDVRGCYNFENYLMTHVPVHPDSKARFKMNIHGHLHGGYVYKHNEHGEITKIKDPWYRNVCMDANNYELVPFEQIQHEYGVYKQRGEIILPPKMDKATRNGELI
jgi:calcineurin-like phosphoesterase family protein